MTRSVHIDAGIAGPDDLSGLRESRYINITYLASESSINISSRSILSQLDDSEKPSFAIFDESLLPELVSLAKREGQTGNEEELDIDLSQFVIHSGTYNGMHYNITERSSSVDVEAGAGENSRSAGDSLKRQKIGKDAKAVASRHSGLVEHYSSLEIAFIMTAIYHSRSLLHHKTVVSECIFQTLQEFDDGLVVFSRTLLSIHEKIKALNTKTARMSTMGVALMKKPIIQRPELVRFFLSRLDLFDKGELNPSSSSEGGKELKFQYAFSQRDVQLALSAAQWEYPPHTELSTIAKGFKNYFGPVHSGKVIKDNTWTEFLRKRVFAKHSSSNYVGRFYGELRDAGFQPSEITSASLLLSRERASGTRGVLALAQRTSEEDEFDAFFDQ